MTLTPEELSSALQSIRDGTNVFDCRAKVENYLVDALKRKRLTDICEAIAKLPKFSFAIADTQPQGDVTVLHSHDGGVPIVIELSHSKFVLSANVDVQRQQDSSHASPNLDDAKFYSTWETLIQSGVEKAIKSSAKWEKAVALIGLFESEMMNGGVGQYLSNSGGEYLGETIQCLQQIGATKSARILTGAAKLREGNQSYDELWEAKFDQLGRLDDSYLACGENLALLTVEHFRA